MGESCKTGTVVNLSAEKTAALSPPARIFHAPKFNCYVVTVIGLKTSIDLQVFMAGVPAALLKNPRFSSKMVGDFESGKMQWVGTKVNLDDHIIFPDLDPDQESPDRFVEDYVSYLTTTPLDTSRPLWELHLLNIRTSDSEATAVLRVHHSMGDGASLMSFLLACTRKTSDPDSLPTMPTKMRAASALQENCAGSRGFMLAGWSVIRLVWNSICDVMMFLVTVMFLKDTNNPIKGNVGVDETTKRFVHRMVSLDDIKLVKNELNMTINDVLLGVTQAGLSSYLKYRYAAAECEDQSKKKSAGFLNMIRLRGIVVMNLRPVAGIQALSEMRAEKSTVRWGNLIGYMLLPFSISHQDDPLEYIRQAKTTIDRKKNSFEAFITSLMVALTLKIFGSKVAAALVYRFFFNTTLVFSNMVGPVEEVSLCGHPIGYIAPGVYGAPTALIMHFQSYANKMTIALSVDPEVIPDPHLLCDYLVESLNRIKAALL